MARPKAKRKDWVKIPMIELHQVQPVAVGNSLGFRIKKSDFELHPDRMYKLTIEEMSR